MPEEIKERLSKTDIASDYSEQLRKSNRKGDSPLTDFTEFPRDYLYMGSVSEMAEIRADENIIRKALYELISEQSAKTCEIPISFARK